MYCRGGDAGAGWRAGAMASQGSCPPNVTAPHPQVVSVQGDGG